jgi:hypothetical protein
MPESNTRPSGLIWPLSKAHEVGQIVRVRCFYCPGRRHYLPGDLQQVLGDVDVRAVSRRMRCERCYRSDGLEADVFVPVASERAKLTVRRLVEIKVRRVPVWRDVKG